MKEKQRHSFRALLSAIAYYVRGTIRRFLHDDILLYGSALAFNFILCIIPLLLLLTWVIGAFLSSSELTIVRINDLLNAAFPDQPYANKIKSSIQDVIFDIVHHRGTFGIVSIIVLIWTATFLFNAARSILNRIYRFKSTKLFLITIVENILSVVVVAVLFLLTNLIFWLSSVVESFVARIPDFRNVLFSPFVQHFPTFVTSVLVFVMFFIVYQFMADRRIPVKAALISACTATVLWVISGKAFQFYLLHLSSVSTVYGTYAFLLVFMIWIEYSSLVFLIGGIIGQLYRERLESLN